MYEGARQGHAQVDEAAVERLALLDHVVLLQQVLQGEAVLVQDQLCEPGGDGRRDEQKVF